MKKVIISVTNDLSTDQRVDKVCNTLLSMGFQVCLVGRILKSELELNRAYETHRMKLLFNKGPFFYAEYNVRLFIYLMSKRCSLLVSNDLDTLLANYLASKIKRIPVVYDSHEYYTGTPELINRPIIQGIWKYIERQIFPRLTDIFTVNDSIAALYEKEYGKKVNVIRNMPRIVRDSPEVTHKQLGIDTDKNIVILQGAGININRGAEEAILSMQYLDDVLLMIIGDGDVIKSLKELALENKLLERVIFLPRMPHSELIKYTSIAEIGLTLDKDTSINYKYSLPNKLFDYIHAGVPVLASPLVEIKKVIEQYKVGMFIDNHEPRHIADRIKFMIDNNYKQQLKENIEIAASKLNWENEEVLLKEVYSKYV